MACSPLAVFLRVAAFVALLSGLPTYAQTPDTSLTKPLLEMKPDAAKRLIPGSALITIIPNSGTATPGLIVTFPPGSGDYPGVSLKPEGASGAIWNLAAYGHVAARVVNLGDQPLTLALRVDNDGDWHDNPWDTETATIAPHAAGTITTIFGYSYGGKPGFALKPAAVLNVLLFAGKSDTMQSFRLESLVAGGPSGETPPVAPDAVRIKPAGGNLLGSAETHIAAQGGAQISQIGVGKDLDLSLIFPANANDASVSIGPPMGRWDLRDYLAVRVRVRNEGKMPVAPRVRLTTNGGESGWISAPTAIAPGTETTLTIPFAGATVADLSQHGTGSNVVSNAVATVTIAATDSPQSERVLRVESVTAVLPPAPTLPNWLGKRPPVPGDWVKTLDDEFDGTTLNPKIWSVYGENYWDKSSHWSKDNVTIGGGVVRLRYEKKTGFNNDDPKQKPSNYASGYLHTYDLWAQRYGYFEARVKLPTAPGLWPAFWMMPDRGRTADPQWKRQDTANGGMEFDILEHLTRWGPNRYNIAMHYDGYGKDHKMPGSDKIYVQPDKDGFITCGLLWTPGSAIYYANGQEVLRWVNPRVSNVPGILMFTLPMGGWDNSPLDDKRLPAEFVIDYVRVWQRKDLK